jgi:RNA-directed DNA polymerase
MQRLPSPKAMKRSRERVHELTAARQSGKDVKQIIATLDAVLRGWGNYFRSGNAHRKFHQLDDYVYTRLTQWMVRRGGQRLVESRGGLISGLWVWVCIDCAEPSSTRRKPHQEDHR